MEDKKVIDICILCGEFTDKCKEKHPQHIEEVWLSNVLTEEEFNKR